MALYASKQIQQIERSPLVPVKPNEMGGRTRIAAWTVTSRPNYTVDDRLLLAKIPPGAILIDGWFRAQEEFGTLLNCGLMPTDGSSFLDQAETIPEDLVALFEGQALNGGWESNIFQKTTYLLKEFDKEIAVFLNWQATSTIFPGTAEGYVEYVLD